MMIPQEFFSTNYKTINSQNSNYIIIITYKYSVKIKFICEHGKYFFIISKLIVQNLLLNLSPRIHASHKEIYKLHLFLNGKILKKKTILVFNPTFEISFIIFRTKNKYKPIKTKIKRWFIKNDLS